MGSIFDLSFAVPTVLPRYSSGREKQQKDLAVDKHFFSDSLPRVIKAPPGKGGFAVDTSPHKIYYRNILYKKIKNTLLTPLIHPKSRVIINNFITALFHLMMTRILQDVK